MSIKLTIEDIVMYLPYKPNLRLSQIGIFNLDSEYPNEHQHKIGGLGYFSYDGDELNGSINITDKYSFDFTGLDEVEFEFYPLSMLSKEIEFNGEKFIPIEKLVNEREVDAEYDFLEALEDDLQSAADKIRFAPLSIVKKLLQWHFWIGDQSYFAKGLLIIKKSDQLDQIDI